MADNQASQANSQSQAPTSGDTFGQHDNAYVPHHISDHTKAVQVSVMTEDGWVNINDTLDQMNDRKDLHAVHDQVEKAQEDIVNAQSAADDAVSRADSAVKAAAVTSDAVAGLSDSAVEAKSAANDAISKAEQYRKNASSEAAEIRNQVINVANDISSVRSDVDDTASDVANLKTNVQANSAAIVETNNAVKIQSKNSSDAINELKIAGGQTEAIAKDANSNATLAKQTATSAAIEATNASSTAAKAELTASGLTTRVEAVEGDTQKLTGRVASTETAIQQTKDALSLKADTAMVDQTNDSVNKLSAEQKIMANEISSKVTSTDVNNIVESKGYATTSSVQSLITQKAGSINESITNLTSEVNSNNGGGVNFAKNTINASYSGNSGSGNIGDISLDDMNELRGQTITLSVDVEWTGWQNASGYNRIGWELQVSYADGSTVNNWLGVWAIPTTASGKQRVSATYTIPDKEITSLDEGAVFVQTNCTSAKVSRLKIERGSVATPYSPAPSDEATVTQVQQITASIDGLQSNVANKADKSQVTQLSNVIQSKVSASDFNNLRKAVDLQTLDSADINNMKTNGHYFVRNLANNPVGGGAYVDVTGNGADRIRQDVYQDSGNQHKYRRWFGTYWTGWEEGATESEITQLRDDINLRVKSGDLLSQINIQAGHTLIQSNKIYFDADSFVMSPNSKAFIPSAFITNLSADKITTGTLDAAKLHVKNFSADNISGGTLSGITVKTGDKNRYFQTSKDSIYWVRDNKTSLIGTDQYINPSDGLVIADAHSVTLTTWYGATVKDDGTITNGSGNIGYPKLILDSDGKWEPDVSGGSRWEGNTGKAQIGQWIADKEYTNLVQGKGFVVHLDDQNKDSIFAIQKDNCFGAYFGRGEHGNHIDFVTSGNDQAVNITGNFHVTGSKNSIVETKQGYLAINAYETAEYYFGDIGESNTGDTSQITIGIDRIFNETVNTDIQYQVFVTPYSDAHVWVEKRYNNRFVVKSDKPGAEFGWELKAKRKGYESNRLRRVNVDFD